MSKTLIIAEAGVNHNGDLNIAYALVDAAHQAGADIVKFQTYVTEQLVTENAEQADYQQANIGQKESQFEMLKRLELTFDEHMKVKAYCDQKGITYLSTAFDLTSLDFLVHSLGLTQLKIPSGEITNAPYLLAHARTNRRLIVSTGMATMDEIADALAVLAYGLVHLDGSTPDSLQACYQVFSTDQGQKALQEKVMLLHCTTEYPAPLEDINLSAMQLMLDTFGLPVGYSDHTEGILVPTIATAIGACVIEKHFTLDRNMSGPDHTASIEPAELTEMVANIRATEKAKGRNVKAPTSIEEKNSQVARKSVIAACDIEQGQPFSEASLCIKRPGTGLTPMKYWQLIKQTAKKSYKSGDIVDKREVV